MNWEAIGAVGEIVGALGVVVTLAYLASQVQSQNRESRLSALTELTTQWNAFLASFVELPYFAEVWTRGINDFSSLSRPEAVQFGAQCGRFMRLVAGFRDQFEHGRLDASAWEGIRRTLDDVTRYPGVKAWWPTRSHWYPDEFITFVAPFIDAVEPARVYDELEAQMPGGSSSRGNI